MAARGIVPRLLVSVRNVDEARAALAGGCDLLDMKEPNHGALGMPSLTVVAQILAECRTEHRADRGNSDEAAAVSFSLALGEAPDWESAEVPPLPAGLDFVKLGTAGLSGGGVASRLLAVMERFEEASGANLDQTAWMLVAYGDAQHVNGPSLLEVAEAARALCCAGILVDTALKDGRDLCDVVDRRKLATAIKYCRDKDLCVAVAGSLRISSLPGLVPFQPDILGIRSAACCDGQRQQAIERDRVAEFRRQMRAEFRKSGIGNGFLEPAISHPQPPGS